MGEFKYPETPENEWESPTRKGFRHMCCDCQLIHEVDTRLVDYGAGKKIQWRWRRLERATAAARREERKRNGASH